MLIDAAEDYVETLAVFGIEMPMAKLRLYDGRNAAHTYASASIGEDNYIKLEPKYHYSDYDTLNEKYAKNVRDGLHPANTTARDVVAHEAGHRLEYYVSYKVLNDKLQKNPSLSLDTQWKYTYEGKAATDIARSAVKKIAKDTGKTEREVRANLSQYSTRSLHETFAEAIADFRRNGENSNPLSVEIAKRVRKALKK